MPSVAKYTLAARSSGLPRFNDILYLLLKFLYGGKRRCIRFMICPFGMSLPYITQDAGQIIPEDGTDILVCGHLS